jgi:Tfp pilus assembly protein FimT
MVEVLIVVVIAAVMIAVALPRFLTFGESYSSSDVSAQVVDALRFANQQALGQRQRMRVEIRPGTAGTPGSILVVDEGKIDDGSDDEEVRNEPLPTGDELSFAKPSGVGLVASPFNFTAARYTNGVCTIHFNPIGSASGDDQEVPLSATIFVSPAGAAKGTADADLVRAITLFGPTGSIRAWGYDPTTAGFVAR